MDFLKKHYEKLVLAFFLIAFVLLLLYLIQLSNSTRAIAEIFILLREKNPKIDEFEGFLGFVLKKMDSENTDEMDRTLMEIWAIINKHYPPIED